MTGDRVRFRQNKDSRIIDRNNVSQLSKPPIFAKLIDFVPSSTFCTCSLRCTSEIPSVNGRSERDPLTLGRIALHCRPGRDRGAKASLPSRRRDKRPRCWGSPARYKPKPPAYPPADDCRATDAGVAQLAGRQSFPGTRRRRHRRSPELLRDLRYGALACIAYGCGSVRVAQRAAHTHVWRI